ncbi:hypothetical protein [Methylocystis sp.]|uniref:hypothetical protein n=1 Tax=Methylocystis sp. TaxID=1911079 RepID=UPI0025D0CD0B|nr:hypothetical protein [Methylocystis sp.]
MIEFAPSRVAVAFSFAVMDEAERASHINGFREHLLGEMAVLDGVAHDEAVAFVYEYIDDIRRIALAFGRTSWGRAGPGYPIDDLRRDFIAELSRQKPTLVVHLCEDELQTARLCSALWPGARVARLVASIEAERASHTPRVLPAMQLIRVKRGLGGKLGVNPKIHLTGV